VTKEVRERLQRELSKSAPLAYSPILEALLAQAKAVQQIATIDRDRLLQGFGRSFGGQSFELVGVDLD
jgi:hypothetical protein